MPNYSWLRALTAITGMLLLVLGYLAALSGLCLKESWLSNDPILGRLGGYPLCAYLHVDTLPDLLIITGAIHVIASTETLAIVFERGGKYYYIAAQLYRVLAWSLVAHLATILVLSHLY
ncbi:hypothetical protein PYJP_08550 [Pyrofollis japonicus]|uniref:hypothetical protein n=1 Tax=Pyrofollis japonicus TaxID=3060460 RepID=UPI00295C0EDE|nr:hypothetical protein [Pyrofollis japonicus]BEP17503.1 hypothetical protein PYJP_08550 [Pyrofollis japonicus]